MIPSDEEDGDVMNTPCPECNEWSPYFQANADAMPSEGSESADC